MRFLVITVVTTILSYGGIALLSWSFSWSDEDHTNDPIWNYFVKPIQFYWRELSLLFIPWGIGLCMTIIILALMRVQQVTFTDSFTLVYTFFLFLGIFDVSKMCIFLKDRDCIPQAVVFVTIYFVLLWFYFTSLRTLPIPS